MLITSKSDYGLRAALHLARSSGLVTLREISVERNIPQSIASQVMRRLVAEGIVASKAGPTGGYRLARHPSDISAAEVLRAADRDICIFKCVEPETCECEFAAECAFRGILTGFGNSIKQQLEALSLEHLVRGEVNLGQPDSCGLVCSVTEGVHQ